jgi:hypothetical protein
MRGFLFPSTQNFFRGAANLFIRGIAVRCPYLSMQKNVRPSLYDFLPPLDGAPVPVSAAGTKAGNCRGIGGKLNSPPFYREMSAKKARNYRRFRAFSLLLFCLFNQLTMFQKTFPPTSPPKWEKSGKCAGKSASSEFLICNIIELYRLPKVLSCIPSPRLRGEGQGEGSISQNFGQLLYIGLAIFCHFSLWDIFVLADRSPLTADSSWLPKMTAHPMLRLHLSKLRENLPADCLRLGAAGVEGAAGWDMKRTGWVALNPGRGQAAFGVGNGHRL